MSDSLRNKTVKGIGWSAVERFSVQGVSFLVQVILARLLLPSDYGIIAVLVIFLQIAQVFIDSGFANALIKKTNCTQGDYSTVFWYNLFIAVILYLILFISAPYIAVFYENSLITSVFRVIALTLIINALSIVQKTRLVKSIDFKSQSKVTFTSSLLSGVVGIVLAYYGCGAWALVAQQLTNSILHFILYICITKWRPAFIWSKESFKYVFDFGSKLLLASLIGVIYKNIYSIIIGKKYSTRELGYFTRADQFATFPSNNISNIISRVSFPILSTLQNDDTKLLHVYRQLIRYSSFVIFPLMYGLLAVSEPFILTVLTDKWAPSIVLLKILCLDWSLDHISLLNLNLLYVKGRTDLVLKLEIIKKIIAIIILIVTIPYGINVICWGRVVYSLVATIVNTYYTKKILNFGFFNQLFDFLPYMIASALMAICVTYSLNISPTSYIQLIIGCITGLVVYSIFTVLFFKSNLLEIKRLICRNKK